MPPGRLRPLAVAQESDKRLATYLALSIESGARRGAVHAVRRNYIHFSPDGMTSKIRLAKVIVIGPDGPVERSPRKTKRTATWITLGPHVTAMLRATLDRQAKVARDAGDEIPDDAFVFSDDPLGARPWRPDSTSRKFRYLRIHIDLDDQTRLHDLRHKMATALLSLGINPKAVAERGAWRQVATMLDRYAHFVPTDDQEAAGLVDRLLQTRDGDQ